ncbi:MAG: tetratricopeptide repeat protein [Chloroflexaceae bacterium]
MASMPGAKLRLAMHYLSHLQDAERVYRAGQDILQSFYQGDWGQISPLYEWMAAHRNTRSAFLELCSDYPAHTPNILNALQTPDERIQWLEIAHEAAHHLGRFDERVAHLGNLALTSRNAGRPKQDILLFENLYEIIKGQNDIEEANVLCLLGECYRVVGRYTEALDVLTRALSVSRGQPYQLKALTYHNLGVTFLNIGDIQRCIEHHTIEKHIAEESRDQAGIARANLSLGIAYAERLEIQAALACYDQALRGTEDKALENSTESALAYLYRVNQHVSGVELVRGVFTEKWQEFTRIPFFGNQGVAQAMIGKYENALISFAEAQRIAHNAGHKRFEAVWLYNTGTVYHALGQYDHARACYEESFHIAQEINAPRAVAFAQAGLGRTYLALAYLDPINHNIRLDELRAAVHFATKINNPRDHQDWSITLAEAYMHAGQLTEAQRVIDGILHYDIARNQHRTFVVQGLIWLLGGAEPDDVRTILESSLRVADGLSKKTPELVTVHYTRGLVFAGLAMLSKGNSRAMYTSQSQAAYTYARHISDAPGVINDARQLLDALQPLDADNARAPIRAVLHVQRNH